ncbi:hypothetical protein ACP4OV_000436 [Aristida adscensionis]
MDIGQVNPEKQICSEHSTQVVCPGDSAQMICSADSVQELDKNLCQGILNKNKDIKSKKHVKYQVVNLFWGSKQLLLGSLKLRKKRRHKRTKTPNLRDSGTTEVAEDKTDNKDAVLTGAKLPSSYASSVANSDSRKYADSREYVNAIESGSWNFNLLTRGLKEITVPR